MLLRHVWEKLRGWARHDPARPPQERGEKEGAESPGDMGKGFDHLGPDRSDGAGVQGRSSRRRTDRTQSQRQGAPDVRPVEDDLEHSGDDCLSFPPRAVGSGRSHLHRDAGKCRGPCNGAICSRASSPASAPCGPASSDAIGQVAGGDLEYQFAPVADWALLNDLVTSLLDPDVICLAGNQGSRMTCFRAMARPRWVIGTPCFAG